MRYTVARLDASIHDRTGMWDICDQHQIGTLDITNEVFEDDHALLNMLITAEYVDASTTIENIYFMGDDYAYLSLHDDDTMRPLLALILEH